MNDNFYMVQNLIENQTQGLLISLNQHAERDT